jgi:ABC-type glycerol-3-phosphate transport system substrate-binding protein
LAGCTHAKGNISPVAKIDSNRTITFTALYGPESQYKNLIDEFEARNPDIDVRLLPLQGYSPNLEDLVGQADTILLGSAIPSTESQLFLDLAPLMATTGFAEAALWPGVLQGCQAGDQQKGLPVSLSPTLVFYNKDLFDQVGLAIPQAGWSWDDFRTAIQALAEPNAVPPRYGFLDFAPASSLRPLIDTLLASGQDAASVEEDLQWYIDLARSGAIVWTGETLQDSSDLIKNGQAAMWLGTLSSLITNWQGLDFKVGVAPFPADSQTQASTPIGVTCAVISAGSAQPSASWAWLDFLSRNLPSDGTYFSPVRTDTTDAGGFLKQLSPQANEVAHYAMEHGWYGWVKPDYSVIEDALQAPITTGKQIAALPEDLTPIAEETALPTAENTPAPVMPPTATPTQQSSNEPNALSAVYYADEVYQTNPRDVIALADEFNHSHPHLYIKVVTQRIGFEDISSNLYDVDHFDCFASSGAVIDNTAGASTENSDFAGKVYTLDPLLETSDPSLLENLNPTLLDAERIDGSLYGLPVAIQPYMVYYNKKLLQELGLKAPSLDWTVEDFWGLAAQVARARDDVYGYVPYGGSEPFYFLSGVNYLDMSKPFPGANYESPEVIGLLNQLAPLVKERALFLFDTGGTRGTGNYQQRDELLQYGQVAMWMDQMGWAPEHLPYDVGVAVLPIQQTLNPAYTTTLYISRRAQNPQVCWEWFKYLNGQHIDVFKGIPVNQSTLDSENWAASVSMQQAEVYRATMAKVQISTVRNNFPPLPLMQWWSDAMVEVLQNGKDASAILKAIQYKAQATLDCMQAAGVPPSLPFDESYETAVNCAIASDPGYQK